MTVEETRRSTSKDGTPKLFATADERFRDAKPSPVNDFAPENWLALPAAQFRDKNYRFGDSGLGEVYVSLTGGTVTENANRWASQFGREPFSAADIAALEKTRIAGAEGVIVEAIGTYTGAMGQGDRPDYALAGVIAEVDGKIITVKMVGPEAEVEKEKEKIPAYAASLSLAE